MASTQIRNVVFDMGGVVLEWNPGRILAGFVRPSRCVRRCRAGAVRARGLARVQPRCAERGAADRAGRRARSGRPTAELAALLEAMRESLVTKPATVALIRTLQQRGIPLYCLSDMPLGVYRYLRERHDFWDAFSGIVISAHVKLVKPDAAIFRHLLTCHGLAAAETVFIDDMAGNVEGARACGMHAIQFHDIGQVQQQLQALLG